MIFHDGICIIRRPGGYGPLSCTALMTVFEVIDTVRLVDYFIQRHSQTCGQLKFPAGIVEVYILEIPPTVLPLHLLADTPTPPFRLVTLHDDVDVSCIGFCLIFCWWNSYHLYTLNIFCLQAAEFCLYSIGSHFKDMSIKHDMGNALTYDADTFVTDI